MSWNGSDRADRSTSVTPPQKKDPHHSAPSRRFTSLQHGLLAGLLVVVLGGTVLWWLANNCTAPRPPVREDGPQASRAIVEAMQPIATNSPVRVSIEAVAPCKLCVDAAKKLSETGDHGFPMVVTDDTGKQWYRGAEVPTDPPGTMRLNGKNVGHRMYFKSKADNYLCNMYLTGQITGSSHAAKDPDDKFYSGIESSLREKVVFDERDDVETREVKVALQKVKDALLERMNRGEKIREIIESEREVQAKVARARENYQQMLRELSQDEKTTARDLEDFIRAANDMLGENNATPLRVSPAIQGRILRSKKGKQHD